MTVAAKSDLQLRAEAAAIRFHTRARSAIVIEFAGVPKAGKTTTLGAVQAFLRRCGFRVNVVVERASVCPIKDKKDANFNVWTACTTLVQILDQTQTPPSVDDPEILVLDRGIFDSIWWFGLMVELGRIRSEDKDLVEKFLLLPEWRRRISGVVVMLANPAEALQRERGHLPVEGTQGSIMNPQVLGKTKEVVEATMARLYNRFKFLTVDTSSEEFSNNPKATCEAVAGRILDWVEEQIEERIFSVRKKLVKEVFQENRVILVGGTEILQNQFLSEGEYIARSEIESDYDRVQALPIVVVRNRNGEILLLQRKEVNKEDRLHEKMVIWAGGHVRKEDAEEGNPLSICAVRELQEELRLRIEPDDLHTLGSIYIDEGTSSKHVAIVYEWRAKTDYIAVSLNNAEFFERQGNSLSCTFVDIPSLHSKVSEGSLHEDWSREILGNMLVA